jgi:predicted dehydrogenase
MATAGRHHVVSLFIIDRLKPTMSANPETSTTRRPGFAVVGLGKMGIMHASMLSAVPGSFVSALVEPDVKTAAQTQSMIGTGQIFADLESCLDTARPAGVILATPQFTHRALLESCLERRVPVLCEKPMAHTLADARLMAQAAARHPDVPVAIGYMLAHNPLFTRAGELLQAGVLGQVKSFRASCRLSQVFSPKQGWTFTAERSGGGVLINSGCHLLYVLQGLFGLPQSVYALAAGVHNTVEDTLHAVLEYANGLFGALEVTWSVPGHDLQTHDIEIIGTKGTLTVGNLSLRLWLAQRQAEYSSGWTEWPRHALPPRAPFTLSPDYCGDEFYLEVADFVDAVLHKHPPKVGVEPALKTQLLLEALYRSAAQHHPVELASLEVEVPA